MYTKEGILPMDDRIDNFDVIFVDCFNTIIFRKKKRKEIFREWTNKLSKIYNVDRLYKLYTNTNFWMCFKKLFTTFTLQESFDNVLYKMSNKIIKKYPNIDPAQFIKDARDLYIETELEAFRVNQDMISFLYQAKAQGKSVYLVSDFYCECDIFTKWFRSLRIENVFTGIYSSSDFQKEKATTKLYRKLISLLSLDHKKVKMYGDNLWSDIMMARLCGIAAKRVKKTTKENV